MLLTGIEMSNHDRIEALIQKTSDPVQQAMLLLFVKFDHALDENTRATQRIADAFEDHADRFEQHTKAFDSHVVDEQTLIGAVRASHNEAISGARVGFTVASVFIGALLALGAWTLNKYVTTVETTLAASQELTTRILILEKAFVREHSGNGNGK
jgi:hypothetical protein